LLLSSIASAKEDAGITPNEDDPFIRNSCNSDSGTLIPLNGILNAFIAVITLMIENPHKIKFYQFVSQPSSVKSNLL
jgi:hypothetical protein